MILRKFNEAGIAAFSTTLERAKNGETIRTPLPELEDSQLTITLATRVEIPNSVFKSRLELASVISEAVRKASLANEMTDIGLWAWISAAYFDSVCPPDEAGLRKPRSDYRHIPSNSYRDFYRHLIRGPVRIYRLFQGNLDSASIVLCQTPALPGDFVEQLTSRQERVTSQAVIGAASALYFDAGKKTVKRGAAPNSRVPGTLRRYMDVLDQLELTYDLYSMTSDQLLAILPSEFEDWKSHK